MYRDRGEVTAQVVIVMPVLLMLLLLALQSAMWFHSANIASAAAAEGAAKASSARIDGDSALEGVRVAAHFVEQAGGQLVATPTASMRANEVSMTVVTRVPHLLPIFPSVVVRTVVEPLERYSREVDR